jgi:high-affinity iron transporter
MSATSTLVSDAIQLIQTGYAPSSVRRQLARLSKLALVVASILLVALMVWQAVAAHGNPDPLAANVSPAAAVLDTGILVFREGLEAILVLAALTASLARTEQGYWKPVALGASASFVASVVTWFVVVAIVDSVSAPALAVQAATGLLAVVVLLVIMNWFFHKIYWSGWITYHNRRKRELTETPGKSRRMVFQGLMLIGFTSIYREGFEVVLFLQSLRLKVGSHLILEGVLIGLALTLLVAILTFVVHYRLPYKRMLVLTGLMLGFVLIVMVGESVQEMQQAGWCTTHTLKINMPDWMNTWFAVFPTVESLASQAGAAALVIGSYFIARRIKRNCACQAQGGAGQMACMPANNCCPSEEAEKLVQFGR